MYWGLERLVQRGIVTTTLDHGYELYHLTPAGQRKASLLTALLDILDH